MVKFVGEGGHDVGGLYNESLVDVCNEIQVCNYNTTLTYMYTCLACSLAVASLFVYIDYIHCCCFVV